MLVLGTHGLLSIVALAQAVIVPKEQSSLFSQTGEQLPDTRVGMIGFDVGIDPFTSEPEGSFSSGFDFSFHQNLFCIQGIARFSFQVGIEESKGAGQIFEAVTTEFYIEDAAKP